MIKKAFFSQKPNYILQSTINGMDLTYHGFTSFEDQYMIPFFAPGTYHDAYWSKKTYFRKLNQLQKEKQPSKTCNVLHVEDCNVLRSLVKLQLRNGFNLTQVETGEEALNVLNSENFDLILMDVNLGNGINGLQASSMIRENPEWSDIPLVIITTNDFNDIKDDCVCAGVDAYLQKPYDKDDLLEVINVFR